MENGITLKEMVEKIIDRGQMINQKELKAMLREWEMIYTDGYKKMRATNTAKRSAYLKEVDISEGFDQYGRNHKNFTVLITDEGEKYILNKMFEYEIE
ncbi:phage antirepressor KilAC domain-containing protein [Sporosarcina sp. SAFN-010]|uniref:phage antirepressor KilAC domain-containing protein n=1 Tax=Sporosarcina sp. SAFN-010 TaxID=3387273 RepID=UPI003F817D0E